MSSSKRRRLAAIMFTDLVGYTALSQKDEPLSLIVLEEQRKLVRPVLAQFNGREVKTIGDAFLVEFPSALEAIKCAYEIQKAARQFNTSNPEERRINLRIGIHLGDIVETQGDITGDAVNVASRIQPFAENGGVSITRQVYDQVQNKFELPLTSLGTKSLKNVSTPVEVYKIDLPWRGEKRSGPSQLDKLRIAVLPFANISPSSSDEYFADGMTEELIATLSRIRELGVIARTSVIRYKGSSKPVTDVGRELNVGTVLEGSVRVAGKKLRITAQLIDTGTEEHLWSDVYDRTLEDAFAIQSDIAQRIATSLQVRLKRGDLLGLRNKSTTNSEAYSLYLKGRYFLNIRTEDALSKAIHYFSEALVKDPQFAPAYSGLADSHGVMGWFEFVPPKEAFPEAKRAAEKALEIDPDLAEAHTSLAFVRFQFDWDWRGAETECRHAIELNPNYGEAHQQFANYLKAMGRFDEALKEVRRAEELDPLSLTVATGIGHVLYLSRRYDEAIDQYGEAVMLDPNFAPAHLWFGRPYLQKGMYREAIAAVEKAVSLSGSSTMALATLGHAYAAAGKTKEAHEVLDRLLERSKRQYVPSYWIALVQVSMGNKDEAFAWLERAYNERSSWLVWVNVEPRFDPLRSDPRFTSLLARIGFEPNTPAPASTGKHS